MRSYLINLTLLIALLTAVLLAVHKWHVPFSPAITWWLLPLLFFSISSAGHSLMIRSVKGKPDQFMIFFLLAITVKMLLYLGLLLVWFIISGHNLETGFVVAFAILYVVITALDLVTILRYQKKV